MQTGLRGCWAESRLAQMFFLIKKKNFRSIMTIAGPGVVMDPSQGQKKCGRTTQEKQPKDQEYNGTDELFFLFFV